MSKSEVIPEPQALGRYHQVQSDVLQLKSRLPQEAVGDIVHEVLNRVTAYRTVNGDRINLPTRKKVEQLCYALISEDGTEGAAFIRDVQKEGASLEAIYLSYLAEAASILGEWWNDDHVTFHEVMIGSSRIYAILREFSYLFVPDHPVEVKSAIFATVPDEIHTLGVQMAADLFGKEGWNIEVKTGRTHDALVSEVTQSPCRILGLSAGGEHSAPALARLVLALRVSRPDLRIFLSGQIIKEAGDIVDLMDIDAASTDVDEAQQILQGFWSELEAEPA
ncbi:cobalamin B12-binding domain-containing protein [Roseobacter weihaiensis]|uniref:cobalamin B12-binding domain-containing protein n=1 Tax=Roseobacter weihaiensis TaxID=2763262 RepID=UPI001D0A872F|nr:cobalamin B12-binding domain-containing protein [Roseobacter sp. H9]